MLFSSEVDDGMMVGFSVLVNIFSVVVIGFSVVVTDFLFKKKKIKNKK